MNCALGFELDLDEKIWTVAIILDLSLDLSLPSLFFFLSFLHTLKIYLIVVLSL